MQQVKASSTMAWSHTHCINLAVDAHDETVGLQPTQRWIYLLSRAHEPTVDQRVGR